MLGDLRSQTRNASSRLYAGNVTVRVDATWGLSGDGGAPRAEANPFLPYAVRENGSLPFYGFPGRSVGAAGFGAAGPGRKHVYTGSAWYTKSVASGAPIYEAFVTSSIYPLTLSSMIMKPILRKTDMSTHIMTQFVQNMYVFLRVCMCFHMNS